MKTRTIIAAALLGAAGVASGIAATAASDTGAQRRAAAEFKAAAKALGKHRVAKAVVAAEAAVALDPRNAGYRTLLGQAYLAAGRFPSAAGALTDALSLDPANGVAALHLALAQIATGGWSAARDTLMTHAGTIPASDRGLALALAGDPSSAVAVLNAAARVPGADAKTRQNLALSLALAGRWNEAKTVASLDMAPAEVDARIMQWAAFAKPSGAADQVASLLGVVPVVDEGQPQRLALTITTPAVAAAQAVTPVDAYMPTQVAAAARPTPAPRPEVAIPSAAAGPAPIVFAAPVVFAAQREVAQALPTAAPLRVSAAPSRSTRMSVVPSLRLRPTAPAVVTPTAVRGTFYVQLGAFDSAGVAKDAWGRLSRRITSLNRLTPQGMTIAARGQNFYRLSVGGFARADANTLCRTVRTRGGVCFVRAGAGDQVASWVRKDVQLAMR